MNLFYENLQIDDLPNVCRVCLKKENLINIVEENGSNKKDLQQIFETVLNEKCITLNYNKSIKACKECVNLLVQFYNFQILYKKSKSTFDQIFILNNSNEKPECFDNFPKDQSTVRSELDSLFNELGLIDNNIKLEKETPEVSGENIDKNSEKKAKLKYADLVVKNPEIAVKNCKICETDVPSVDYVEHKKYGCKKSPAPATHKFNRDLIKCTLCDAKMLRINLMRHHLNKHKGLKIKIERLNDDKENFDRLSKFECEICGLPNIRHLNKHYKVYHQIDVIICKICNRYFVSKTKLKEHCQQVHKMQNNKERERINKKLIISVKRMQMEQNLKQSNLQ